MRVDGPRHTSSSSGAVTTTRRLCLWKQPSVIHVQDRPHTSFLLLPHFASLLPFCVFKSSSSFINELLFAVSKSAPKSVLKVPKMGEVELVDASSVEAFGANRQGNEQQHDFTEFLSTNRAGRRNALPHLAQLMGTSEPMAACSSQVMTVNFGQHEDLSVAGLAQKLQQLDTGTFSDQPSTSGHCSGFGELRRF